MTRPTLADLYRRLELLEQQQRLYIRVLESYGIRGPWLSPADAAPLLGVSADWIKDQIAIAEQYRSSQKDCKLSHGRHYRNLQSQGTTKPSWQVHLFEFDSWIAIPHDERWN